MEGKRQDQSFRRKENNSQTPTGNRAQFGQTGQSRQQSQHGQQGRSEQTNGPNRWSRQWTYQQSNQNRRNNQTEQNIQNNNKQPGQNNAQARKSNFKCLFQPGKSYLPVRKIDHYEVYLALSRGCPSIEHQFIALRNLTQLNSDDYKKRQAFTKLLLDCIGVHEGILFEGIIFGSSVNGLGFKDSDVDLKLRPLIEITDQILEPYIMDDERVMRFLKKISRRTVSCAPARGEFVPSTRCPVAKLKFYTSPHTREEGLSYDISLSSSNFLGPFNSMFLRFLCTQQPKFHLLATVLRYWSSRHNLIQPGKLSSYALVNMLIFFCQTTDPPLLPSVDHMRETYLKHMNSCPASAKNFYTQVEWQCILSFDKKFFVPSLNQEPLSLILLKFFEFYLKFPYDTHIITIRPGRALTHSEFKSGNQFHPKFTIKEFLNIQDPFDLKHNLTLGIPGGHFRLFMLVMRHSYERLHYELMNNFERPAESVSWGLTRIFERINDERPRKPPKVNHNKQVKGTNAEVRSTK